MSEAKAEAKSEGGEEKQYKAEGKGEGFVEPIVECERIDIEQGPLPLTDPLDLEVDFKLDRPLCDATWQIKVSALSPPLYNGL